MREWTQVNEEYLWQLKQTIATLTFALQRIETEGRCRRSRGIATDALMTRLPRRDPASCLPTTWANGGRTSRRGTSG